MPVSRDRVDRRVPDLICRVRQTLIRYAMTQDRDRILVGLSGGPDSIALTRALMVLRFEFGFEMAAAHLNHGLRGDESLRDEHFVRQFARSLGISLTVETRDIRSLAKQHRLSLEEAGRNARYEFFNRIAAENGYTRIATGHNRDDNVELVLMNLMRGSGPQGLRGIPGARDRLIRPLIQCPKTDILAFLDGLGQPFVTDSSNQDPAYLRNRVRHQLIPLLEDQFNPDIRTGINRLSDILSTEDDYMQIQAQKAFERVCEDTSFDRAVLSIPDLLSCHPALGARVIRSGILHVKQDLRRITHTHIGDVFDLCRGESGKSLDLPGRIRVYKKGHDLIVQQEKIALRQLGRRQKQKGGKTLHPSP